MKNPFTPPTSKEEKRFQQDLQRWRQMATVTGETDQAILKSQPPSVLKLVGPRIEREFSIKAKDSGELFAIEEKDSSGRDVTRYYGDIKEAFKPFLEPTIPCRIAKTIWHDGHPYLESQIPPSVQMARAMAEIGRSER